jgi:hypothetical protein
MRSKSIHDFGEFELLVGEYEILPSNKQRPHTALICVGLHSAHEYDDMYGDTICLHASQQNRLFVIVTPDLGIW